MEDNQLICDWGGRGFCKNIGGFYVKAFKYELYRILCEKCCERTKDSYFKISKVDFNLARILNKEIV